MKNSEYSWPEKYKENNKKGKMEVNGEKKRISLALDVELYRDMVFADDIIVQRQERSLPRNDAKDFLFCIEIRDLTEQYLFLKNIDNFYEGYFQKKNM